MNDRNTCPWRSAALGVSGCEIAVRYHEHLLRSGSPLYSPEHHAKAIEDFRLALSGMGATIAEILALLPPRNNTVEEEAS